ncbi:hypothetical protein GCM10011488_27570 [Steroidobacter agaridevorans]|nr:DNA repair protein RadC [Steroidobacter agaridevorans]GFE87803.1 hypothetical protein GCM10011488_27570 [Steroidobacter agaridevorans]
MCECNGSIDNSAGHASSGSLPDRERFTTTLSAKHGGRYVKLSDDAVIAVALRLASKRMILSDPINEPRAAREYLQLRFGRLEYEVFSCLYLDAKCRVIACVELFRGTVDGAAIHPREVVKQALAYNATSVIFVHNHPSGVAEPSPQDRLITRRLKEALALIDVRVEDHLVVGDATIESMAERGLL